MKKFLLIIFTFNIILGCSSSLKKPYVSSSKKVEKKFYLKPNKSGQFTQDMILEAINNGHKHIVFDAEEWNVYYSNATYHKVHKWSWAIELKKINWGTDKHIILDFTKCHIKGILNKNEPLQNHFIFHLVASKNIEFRFGKVTGDKYQRDFKTKKELWNESTTLVKAHYGCVNICINGGDISAFMGDAFSSNGYGAEVLAWNPEMFLQKDGTYQTKYFDINKTKTDDGSFALMAGVGYNRLMKFDMDNVSFLFKDKNGRNLRNLTSSYLNVEYFPKEATQIAIKVIPTDGRKTKKTKFGYQLAYRPSRKLSIKNTHLFDFHRGSVSNLGNDAIIENNVFENTTNYKKKPEFPSSTKYAIDLEDNISSRVTIRNNKFINKFHSILITDAIEVDIQDNTFNNCTYDIYMYRVVRGIVKNNHGSGRIRFGEYKNNKQIKAENNTIGNLIRTESVELKNNTIKNEVVR